MWDKVRISKEWRQPDLCQWCGGPAPTTRARTIKVPAYVFGLLIKDMMSSQRYAGVVGHSTDQKTIAVYGPTKTYYFEIDDER